MTRVISEELKRRISVLQRGDGRSRRAAEEPGGRSPSDPLRHLPEGEVSRTEHGEVFVCETGLAEAGSGAAALLPRYLKAFGLARRLPGDDALPGTLQALVGARPERTALVDTETAGFHGRPLFLIGLARYDGADLRISQCFARTYAEEAGVLARFGEQLADIDLVITFNGKAFDWPFVRDRMAYHRLSCEPSFSHLDLLHPSRRRWRSELPDCKLKTLERYLCGRWRRGDLPGEEIPQRYHNYVRGQDARLIAPVFHHNRLDLIAMVELFVALVEAEAAAAGGDYVTKGSIHA